MRRPHYTTLTILSIFLLIGGIGLLTSDLLPPHALNTENGGLHIPGYFGFIFFGGSCLFSFLIHFHSWIFLKRRYHSWKDYLIKHAHQDIRHLLKDDRGKPPLSIDMFDFPMNRWGYLSLLSAILSLTFFIAEILLYPVSTL